MKFAQRLLGAAALLFCFAPTITLSETFEWRGCWDPGQLEDPPEPPDIFSRTHWYFTENWEVLGAPTQELPGPDDIVRLDKANQPLSNCLPVLRANTDPDQADAFSLNVVNDTTFTAEFGSRLNVVNQLDIVEGSSMFAQNMKLTTSELRVFGVGGDTQPSVLSFLGTGGELAVLDLEVCAFPDESGLVNFAAKDGLADAVRIGHPDSTQGTCVFQKLGAGAGEPESVFVANSLEVEPFGEYCHLGGISVFGSVRIDGTLTLGEGDFFVAEGGDLQINGEVRVFDQTVSGCFAQGPGNAAEGRIAARGNLNLLNPTVLDLRTGFSQNTLSKMVVKAVGALDSAPLGPKSTVVVSPLDQVNSCAEFDSQVHKKIKRLEIGDGGSRVEVALQNVGSENALFVQELQFLEGGTFAVPDANPDALLCFETPSGFETLKMGDFNLDGSVDQDDVTIFCGNVGEDGSFTWEDGDSNGDGLITAVDGIPLAEELGSLNCISPIVVSVTINTAQEDPLDLPSGSQPTSWLIQRSDIRDVQIRFSAPMEAITSDDVQLFNLGVDALVSTPTEVPLGASNIAHSEGSDVLQLNFGQSELPDGVYQVVVDGSVQTTLMIQYRSLDGDGDGIAGDDFVFTGSPSNRFYKLTGDWNGDFGVSIFDFSILSYWFGIAGDEDPEYMDLNNDGGVSIFDFSGYAANFGIGVVFPFSPPEIPISLTKRELTPDGLEQFDFFARDVAVDGDYAVACSEDLDGDNSSSSTRGEVFVFKKSPSGDFDTYERLTDMSPVSSNRRWCRKPDIEGDRLIFGPQGNGRSYMHEFDEASGQWEFVQSLNGTLDSGTRGGCVDGDLAAHAAVFATYEVDILERNAVSGEWDYVQTIMPESELTAIWGMDLKDDVLVFGGAESSQDPGSVFIYTRENGTFTHTVTLTPSDGGSPSDFFGAKVELNDNGVLAVSSSRQDGAVRDEGAVYLYRIVDGEWTEVAEILAEGDPLVRFGTSMCLGEDLLVAGGRRNSSNPVLDMRVFVNVAGDVWTEVESLPFAGQTCGVSGHDILIGDYQASFNGEVSSGRLFQYTYLP